MFVRVSAPVLDLCKFRDGFIGEAPPRIRERLRHLCMEIQLVQKRSLLGKVPHCNPAGLAKYFDSGTLFVSGEPLGKESILAC